MFYNVFCSSCRDCWHMQYISLRPVCWIKITSFAQRLQLRWLHYNLLFSKTISHILIFRCFACLIEGEHVDIFKTSFEKSISCRTKRLNQKEGFNYHFLNVSLIVIKYCANHDTPTSPLYYWFFASQLPRPRTLFLDQILLHLHSKFLVLSGNAMLHNVPKVRQLQTLGVADGMCTYDELEYAVRANRALILCSELRWDCETWFQSVHGWYIETLDKVARQLWEHFLRIARQHALIFLVLRVEAFDLPERGQIQNSEVEDFLCQILKFNTQFRIVRDSDIASRFVRVEMICLLFGSDH